MTKRGLRVNRLTKQRRRDPDSGSHRFAGTITTDVILARLRSERRRRLITVGRGTHVILAVATVALAGAMVAQRYRGLRIDTLWIAAALVAAGWILIFARWAARRIMTSRPG